MTDFRILYVVSIPLKDHMQQVGELSLMSRCFALKDERVIRSMMFQLPDTPFSVFNCRLIVLNVICLDI